MNERNVRVEFFFLSQFLLILDVFFHLFTIIYI